MPGPRDRAPPLPPIEVAFPDLGAHASGNTGIPYAWSFGNSRAGPEVLVQALTHGNEVCGAIVLDRLLREELRPVRGTLSLVFANVAAYLRFNPTDPFASRCVDEDFNRLWSAEVLDSERASAELTRARELRPLYDRADYLLDLHSMSDPCPPLAMAGRQRKGVELAQAIGMPQHIVIDGGHVAGRRLRDYAFFDDPEDVRNALLVECGQHWEAAAPVVAMQATLRFLRHFGMLDAERLERELDPLPVASQRLIEVTTTVTIATDAFRFTRPVRGLQSIARAGTVYAADGDEEIRTPHDNCVLIMPTRRPRKGETAVRLGRYVA
ncbi:MAG TPA: succinylglutamate desuccinylase/aspartoacylase family protein [Casimicrobiaceae bacterium]|nr:succinylglutamate desuccinylase/aspartoacylase family protein [Casimicrobiaceae bacterium]